MSASSYYNEDGSSGQNRQQHSNQYPQSNQQQPYGSPGPAGYNNNQQSGASNPYDYPTDNTPQPYYGQNQSQNYNQQSYGQQSGYPQSYSQYGSGGTDRPPPPYGGDNNQYPPRDQQHSPYPSQGPYDGNGPRQEGYNHPQQQQQQGPPNDMQWGYGGGGPTSSQPGQAPYDPNNPETERGFLGAVAGGVAGAYGGHKLGHGFIGGLGGAIAGSKLEDYAKEKKKEKKEEEERRKEEEKRLHDEEERRRKYGAAGMGAGAGAAAYMAGPGHYQQQQQQHGEPLKGNFSGSANNIQLDGDYDLIAQLYDRNGQQKMASIDLNKHLTNEWGHFRWVQEGGNFGASARGVRLVDNGRVLEAELGDGQGGYNRDYVRLDERLGNSDGDFLYLS